MVTLIKVGTHPALQAAVDRVAEVMRKGPLAANHIALSDVVISSLDAFDTAYRAGKVSDAEVLRLTETYYRPISEASETTVKMEDTDAQRGINLAKLLNRIEGVPAKPGAYNRKLVLAVAVGWVSEHAEDIQREWARALLNQ